MLAVLVVVGELDLSGGHVVQRHIRDVGLEGLSDPLADQLDQCVEIELRRECLADAIDRRELRHALPRLVHEPGVVQRDAHAAGDRREEALVGIGEGVVRSAFWSEMTPVARPPTTRGTKSAERIGSPLEDGRVAVPLGHLRRPTSSIISGSRVSITCLRKPISGIGFSCSRSPRSMTYGKWSERSHRRRPRC